MKEKKRLQINTDFHAKLAEAAKKEAVHKMDGLVDLWCRGRDSNPHGLLHTPLKRARLPITPPRQVRELRTAVQRRNLY